MAPTICLTRFAHLDRATALHFAQSPQDIERLNILDRQITNRSD
jgi:hypothetical protein